MKISVIIPVLNERDHLPATIESVRRTEKGAGKVSEIIVADGGSHDGTAQWLRTQPDIRIVEAERGRGKQLQSGAQIATGDVLLFLHGDCLLPVEAATVIAEKLNDRRTVGGCFLIGFAKGVSLSLRIIARGINARTMVTHTGTGDQAIFVRREIYETLGGFKPWPLFEDIDLVARLRRLGKFAVLRSVVTISARRWIAYGPWRTTLLMYALRIGYWLGISPVRLREWFMDVRH